MDKLESLVSKRLSAAMGGAQVLAKQDRATHRWTVTPPSAKLEMSSGGLLLHMLLVEEMAGSVGVTQESLRQVEELRRAAR